MENKIEKVINLYDAYDSKKTNYFLNLTDEQINFLHWLFDNKILNSDFEFRILYKEDIITI